MRTAGLALLALGMAACTDAPDRSAEAEGPPEAPAQIPDAAEVLPEGESSDMDAPQSEARSGDGYSSAYTTLDLDGCEVLTSNPEEGASTTWRCPGYKGVALFVQEGDLRFDVDAGVENDRFDTPSPFNRLGETVEWRMKDGAPVAVIFRYIVHNEIGPQPTELAVESIGTPRSAGCRVGRVAGSAPDANRQARRIADESAAAFDCANDQPIAVGSVS